MSASGYFQTLNPYQFWGRLQGVTVGHRQNFEDLLRALGTHDIKLVIDATYPLAVAAEAFRHLESEAHFGKVCVEI